MDEGAPEVFAGRLGEHDLDAAGGFLAFAHNCPMRVKARGDYAGVVQDQQVAGLEERGEFREDRIAQSAGGAIHHERTTLAALCGRLLGNQLRRQVEVEVGDAEGGHGIVFRNQFPSGAKAHIFSADLMYGLKPVPFKEILFKSTKNWVEKK